jgi:hypothetical protein
MHVRLSWISRTSLVAASALALGLAALAQALPTATVLPDSRVEIYGGYGYFHPVDSDIGLHPYQSILALNATASVTGYFNRYLGVQVEGSYFSGSSPRGALGQCVNGACSDRDPRVYTAQAGPVFRLPLDRFVPFAHVLGGGSRISGPVLNPLTWGYGVTGGVGMDYILPYFHQTFAIRPIQADFQYSHIDYGKVSPDGNIGGVGEIYAVKLSGGVVVRFGAHSETRPVELGCTTQPGSVFIGEPVIAHASIINMPPNKHPFFTWTSTGGKVTPDESSATIDTTGLAPGDYTASSHMAYGKKASEQAICVAPFSVRAFDPPTVTCSPTPPSVIAGGTVIINSYGISPQNRPLTYSYSASAGQIVSSGPTAKLSTDGLDTTKITVTCNLVDDLGKSAIATTLVSVFKQPAPVIPQTTSLCGMSFERDRARPVRVDNEAKGCLDDIALTLNQQMNAQLFIVGNAGPNEPITAAAERTLNIRQYLMREKGIDPARIYVRVGNTPSRSVRTSLVPPGATFDAAGTTIFDEAAIKPHGQAYGTAPAPATPKPATPHHPRKHVATPPPPQ